MGDQNPPSSTTYGVYAHGNFTANKVINNVNVHSSPPKSRIDRKPPFFRCSVPTPYEHYKGRGDTLGELQEFYAQLPKKSSHCWERIVAIVGLGGMGKTETACRYAAQNREAFPNAAWINAETVTGMLNSFFDLAKKLGIAEGDQNSADLNLVKKVYDYIDKEYDDGVLFIFDNAIQLNSDGAEVGILDFLPTDDLPNQRFPNILITTQTPHWGRRIKTLQVEGLKQEEAFDFFASCFKVKPSECTEEFKMLDDLLKGYPLCMNLAVSSIDFDPNEHSVGHLKQEIKEYVDKVNTEQSKLVNEKIQPPWAQKYNKTISTVWKLTQERIEKEEDGPEALEILQIMSFLRLPVSSDDVHRILQSNADCPHLKDKDIQFRLKKLFRVLEKLYAVRILKVYRDSEEEYKCTLGIHRLVQLVVREQTNCNQALETVLRSVVYKNRNASVNLPVLEHALENPRTQLTSWSLLYVLALAYEGYRTARNLFEMRTPETEADAIFWRLFSLMTNTTTSEVNANQVIRELVGLSKSSELLLVDRNFLAEVTLALAYPNVAKKHLRKNWENLRSLNLNLDSLDDPEDLTVELILTICSFPDSICLHGYCRNDDRVVVDLMKKLVVGFLQVDTQKPKSVTVDRLAAMWLTYLAKLRGYESQGRSPWRSFWKTLGKTFITSPDSSQFRIAELRKCLWNRGLADELVQAFESFKLDDSSLDWYQAFPECIYVSFDGIDLLDTRCQQVILAFTETATNCYSNHLDSTVPSFKMHRFNFIFEVCLVWIKLLLMDDDPNSGIIIECLTRCEPLNWFEGISEDIIRDIERYIFSHHMRRSHLHVIYSSEYFGEFIRRYSSSSVKQIQALTVLCNVALSIPKPLDKKTPFRCNIPIPARHCKGRQDALGELQKFYNQLPEKSYDCWERITAIVGLGGMGKTETACKFTADNREAFPNAVWINAETEEGILNSFLDLAKELGIAREDQKSADLNLVKQVYRYIDQEYDSIALFIFDDAIQLKLDEANVGILDFLPTDEPHYQRFPNILITTQTPDWGRRIKTLQVQGLKQEEALEFYASCFKVKLSECSNEFKMLNDLLEGYPLCMNLAVSIIDFDPYKDSVGHLKQKIHEYICKVIKEQRKLVNEKIKPAWDYKYNRTLSTVWKLTQERLQNEVDGPEALEILQIMSFLHVPVDSVDVVRILKSKTDYSHLEDKVIQFRLKELFRVLEKFHLVQILKVYRDSEEEYKCTLGIHRLVQLVVRQQTNCNWLEPTIL